METGGAPSPHHPDEEAAAGGTDLESERERAHDPQELPAQPQHADGPHGGHGESVCGDDYHEVGRRRDNHAH
jgi:hypothetical protein